MPKSSSPLTSVVAIILSSLPWLCFSQNYFNVKFNVVMSQETVSPNDLHLAGNFNGWNPSAIQLFDPDGDDIWSVTIPLLENTTFNYKFFNGNTLLESETVPNGCAVDVPFIGTARELKTGNSDLVLPVVCFNACSFCQDTIDGFFNTCLDSNNVVCADLINGIYTPGLLYQWFEGNGTPIDATPVADACFTLNNTQYGDAGQYKCEISSTALTGFSATYNASVSVFPVDTFGTKYYPDQYVVQFAPGTPQTVKDSLHLLYGVTLCGTCMCDLECWILPDTINYPGSPNPLVDPNEKKDKVGDEVAVEGVDFNYVAETTSFGQQGRNSIGRALPKPLPMIDQAALAPPPDATQSVVVAVIDSGVDYNHNELSTSMWVNEEEVAGDGKDDDCNCQVDDRIGYDFGDDDPNPIDISFGHGTHVAGLVKMAANYYINPPDDQTLKIMNLKVFDDLHNTSVFKVCCALLYATDKHVPVINMSLGWESTASEIMTNILAAAQGDCAPLVVTSAGNDTLNNIINPHWPSNYNGTFSNVLSVAAIKKTGDQYLIEDYSNFGLNVDIGTFGTLKSYLPNQGFSQRKGTSMATGVISGWAARLFYHKQDVSALQAKDCLLGSALMQSGLISAIQNGRIFDPASLASLQKFTNCIDAINPVISCDFETQRKSDLCPTPVNEIIPAQDIIQVFPQPFTNEVFFSFETMLPQEVSITILNGFGGIVFHSKRSIPPGPQQLRLDTPDLSPGFYFFMLDTGKAKYGGKLIKVN